LRISIGSDDSHAQVVALAGDVDCGTGAAVLDCVSDLAQRGNVVVDLRDAQFLDSAGLAALLGARRVVARSGGTFTLRNPPRFIARVLALSGIDRLVDVEW
jgi:anti-anti-sigma factor